MPAADEPQTKVKAFSASMLRKHRGFLLSLAEGNTIGVACKEGGVAVATVYRHREQDDSFAALWEEALEAGVQVLEQEARRRAVDGVEEPVFWQGQVVGHVRKMSDTLLIFLLKAKRPAVYRENTRVELTGADGDPVKLAIGDARAKLIAEVDRIAARRQTPQGADGADG